MVNIRARSIFSPSVLFLVFLSGSTAGASAETAAAAPGFWDPGLRLERPDLSRIRAIRFLTSDDYPPLNFALEDGTLRGFNVEIARSASPARFRRGAGTR
jgi:polar amino acid transport system substrate-binding protein